MSYLLFLGGSLFILSTVIYTLPKVLLGFIQQYFPSVIFKLPPKKSGPPRIALTIDDVPRNHTTEILDVLKEHEVRCTFFVISDFAKKNPDLLTRMIKDGHELGNHMNRDQATFLLQKDQFEKGFNECHDLLTRYQLDTRWFRPGCGLFNQRIIDHIEKEDYRMVLGDSYPHDPQVRIWQLNEWYLRRKIEPNSIIILHDLAGTIPLLKSLLPDLKKEGYKFVTLSEGFDYK